MQRPMSEPIRRRERGSILIMTALTLTGMLGVTALALDAAYMYDQRNRMGAAADAAALAAAQEYKRASTAANLQAYANHAVALHATAMQMGLSVVSGSSNVTTCSPPADTSQISVCVNSPPQSGPF